MKKFAPLLAQVVMLFAVMQLAGCRKIIDKYFPGHGNDNDNCRIEMIEQEGRIGTFYYNSNGDPDSVIFDTPFGSAGAQFFHFKYDEYDRLIEYNSYYDRDPANFFEMHHYGYSAGRIVVDSAWIQVAGVYQRIADLEYDSQGRIVMETGKTIEPQDDGSTVEQPFDPVTFDYDEDGNLIWPSVDSYDDRTSFLRTNRIWMFIERNYSQNNPAGAVQYNSSDLPLGFEEDTPSGFLQQNTLPTVIEYQCW